MDNFSAVYHLSKASDKLHKAVMAQLKTYNKLKKGYDKETAKKALQIDKWNEVEYWQGTINQLIRDINRADAADEQGYVSKERVDTLIYEAEKNADRTEKLIAKIKEEYYWV